MSAKKKLYCAVSDCNLQENVEKRHFFKFPKEYDRWLQWTRACGRSDLEPKGLKYASQNCRLCHLHFEEKWYNVNKIRARLHPDAVPTKFFGSTFDKNNAVISNMEEENADAIQVPSETQHEEVQILRKTEQQKETQKMEDMEIEERNRSNPAGSSIPTIEAKKTIEDSPRKRKLRMKIKKLKAQNKSLRETVRRLRMEKKERNGNETRKTTVEEEAEYETLRNLGNLYGNYSVANFGKQRTREADN